MIMSWHFFTYFPSALMMVCRKLRYWMWRPCVARQWIKWCSTDSLISEQSWKLLLKMCCIVSASRSWEREKTKNRNKNTMNKHEKHLRLVFFYPPCFALTPGVRKRLRCLWRSVWFSRFPVQNFCRNRCVYLMISCILVSFC